MKLSDISFKNYRNLQTCKIHLSDNTNVLYGQNAQGKTNILEAVWLLTGGRSFRGAKDADLPLFGENYAEIEGTVILPDRESKIQVRVNHGKRVGKVNGIDRGSIAEIIGIFKAIIFSPEHLMLIKGGPENRRKFVDAAICQLNPQYILNLVRYNKVLKHRNMLLKSIPYNQNLKDTLSVWDIKIAEYGSLIIRQRLKYLSYAIEFAKNIYYKMSGGENLQIKYKYLNIEKSGNISQIKEMLALELKQSEDTDLNRGFTSVGPHRDDLMIEINGKSAKLFASQGQQRSAVISLKLAEAKMIEKEAQDVPVVLLDDILSELDEKRQEYLLGSIEDAQTIISGCVKPKMRDGISFFEVNKGTISCK